MVAGEDFHDVLMSDNNPMLNTAVDQQHAMNHPNLPPQNNTELNENDPEQVETNNYNDMVQKVIEQQKDMRNS